jgi:hypothetical protein
VKLYSFHLMLLALYGDSLFVHSDPFFERLDTVLVVTRNQLEERVHLGQGFERCCDFGQLLRVMPLDLGDEFDFARRVLGEHPEFLNLAAQSVDLAAQAVDLAAQATDVTPESGYLRLDRPEPFFDRVAALICFGHAAPSHARHCEQRARRIP